MNITYYKARGFYGRCSWLGYDDSDYPNTEYIEQQIYAILLGWC